MSERDKNPSTPTRRSGRRYERPRVLSRESLEILAIVCEGPGAKTVEPICDATNIQS